MFLGLSVSFDSRQSLPPITKGKGLDNEQVTDNSSLGSVTLILLRLFVLVL